MKRFLVLSLVLLGCSDDPFPEDQHEYIIAFIIDRSGSYQDQFADSAFSHFMRVKESLFRDVMGTESLILLSQINGGSESILFEGSPRAFSRKFPTKERFLEFLNQTPPSSSPVYECCADTIERLCRRHAQNADLHSMLLIYSDMDDTHGGEEKLKAAVTALARFPCAVGVYGAHEKWAEYFTDCGIKHCVAYDSKRIDPPLPQLP